MPRWFFGMGSVFSTVTGPTRRGPWAPSSVTLTTSAG
eukprot:COSAG04_NODE_18389_length_443_cov_0.744186_1_plen_36_part_10